MGDPSSIKLIVFDVDGVLTDGTIVLDDRGIESKRFHVRDGFAIKAAMALGLKIGVLTARSTPAVTHRMNELGVSLLNQGASDKALGLESLCQQAGVRMEEVAYVGDDLVDLPAMLRCGHPFAVADAVAEVQAAACYSTAARGGHGAAREVIEHVLQAQGRWNEVVEKFGI